MRKQGAKRPNCEECKPLITDRAAEAFSLFQLCVPSLSGMGGIDYPAIETILDINEVEDKPRMFELILVCFSSYFELKKPPDNKGDENKTIH